MLERASIAGGATVAVILVVILSIIFYTYVRQRRKEQRLRYNLNNSLLFKEFCFINFFEFLIIVLCKKFLWRNWSDGAGLLVHAEISMALAAASS